MIGIHVWVWRNVLLTILAAASTLTDWMVSAENMITKHLNKDE